MVTCFKFLTILYRLQQCYINSLVCLSLEKSILYFSVSEKFIEFREFIPSFPMFHQSKMANSNISGFYNT